MKKFLLPACAAFALVAALPANASTEKICKPFKDTKHYSGCEKALNTAVDQLNTSLMETGKIVVKPKVACADMSKKKDKGLKGGTPFALCVKTIKKFVESIPPPPPAPGS